MALTLGATLHAQSDAGGVMQPVPPLPRIGLPLPPIGLPWRPDAALPAPRDREPARDSPARGPRRGGVPPVMVLVPYGWSPVVVGAPKPGASAPATHMNSEAPAPEPARATLYLDLQPPAVFQVFVDGYYQGMTDQLVGGVELEPGPHAVELKGEAVEPMTFRVNVREGETLTYRDRPQPMRPARAGAADPAVARPASRATLYVIPGCYAGNVRPEPAGLPTDCDIARLTTVTP